VKAKAYCDGRGNAGTGACAAVIFLENGRVEEYAVRLTPLTNNEAEYKGVILAIEKAIELGVTDLTIFSDSQLVVRQLNGIYKTENVSLAHLMAEAIRLAHQLGKIAIEWVPRTKTKRPDYLCRKIDRTPSPRRRPLPPRPQPKNPFSGS
jgi:ribonuclease HI